MTTTFGPFLLGLVLALSQGSSCGESKPMSNSNKTQTNVAQKSETNMKGQWGGQHVAMQVEDNGATLEFDCARGTITEAISPDRDGKFSVKGSFLRESPGPSRQGEDGSGQPAVYSGTVDGEIMTLTVKLAATNEDLGTFTLGKGKSGRIRKCA